MLTKFTLIALMICVGTIAVAQEPAMDVRTEKGRVKLRQLAVATRLFTPGTDGEEVGDWVVFAAVMTKDSLTHYLTASYDEMLKSPGRLSNFGAFAEPVISGDKSLLVRVFLKSTHQPVLTKDAVSGVFVATGDTTHRLVDISEYIGQLFIVGELNQDIIQAAHHGDLVKVVVTLGPTSIPASFEGRVQRKSEAYGMFGQSTLGIWAPIGLFMTSLNRSPGGVSFSAFPISAAFGRKFHPGKTDFYLGVSAIATWAYSTRTDSTALVSTVGVGALFDVNSYFYAAAAEVVDLRSNGGHGKLVFGGGIAPAFLSLFVK